MQGSEIKEKLKEFIALASLVDPDVEERLKNIERWIEKIKDGDLTSRQALNKILAEMLTDVELWLNVQLLSTEDRQVFFDSLLPTQRYWYGYLLPKWFKQYDRKFNKWKREIMAGNFPKTDVYIIRAIAEEIESREMTDVFYPIISDLSMSTDIIVSGRKCKPLCIQITSSHDTYIKEKYEEWENTLREWDIKRGLFVSYNPSQYGYIRIVVNIILYNSDNLTDEKYLKHSF